MIKSRNHWDHLFKVFKVDPKFKSRLQVFHFLVPIQSHQHLIYHRNGDKYLNIWVFIA